MVPELGSLGQQGAQPVWDVCGGTHSAGGERAPNSRPSLLFGNSQPVGSKYALVPIQTQLQLLPLLGGPSPCEGGAAVGPPAPTLEQTQQTLVPVAGVGMGIIARAL